MGRKRIKRVHKMTPESRAVIEGQLEEFRQRFGREPGPNDPIFFDPANDIPTAITEKQFMDGWREAAAKAGLDVSDLSDDELWDKIMNTMRRYGPPK